MPSLGWLDRLADHPNRSVPFLCGRATSRSSQTECPPGRPCGECHWPGATRCRSAAPRPPTRPRLPPHGRPRGASGNLQRHPAESSRHAPGRASKTRLASPIRLSPHTIQGNDHRAPVQAGAPGVGMGCSFASRITRAAETCTCMLHQSGGTVVAALDGRPRGEDDTARLPVPSARRPSVGISHCGESKTRGQSSGSRRTLGIV